VGRSMGVLRRRKFSGRVKRARRALRELSWKWVERGAVLVGLSWLLLRAHDDSTPAPRRAARGDSRRPDRRTGGADTSV
jgi:hypothetical protein